MKTKTAKQELKNWIDRVDDKAVLEHLQSIKESTENPTVSWDELPAKVKQSIQQAHEDVKAGRLVSDKKF